MREVVNVNAVEYDTAPPYTDRTQPKKPIPRPTLTRKTNPLQSETVPMIQSQGGVAEWWTPAEELWVWQDHLEYKQEEFASQYISLKKKHEAISGYHSQKRRPCMIMWKP